MNVVRRRIDTWSILRSITRTHRIRWPNDSVNGGIVGTSVRLRNGAKTHTTYSQSTTLWSFSTDQAPSPMSVKLSPPEGTICQAATMNYPPNSSTLSISLHPS